MMGRRSVGRPARCAGHGHAIMGPAPGACGSGSLCDARSDTSWSFVRASTPQIMGTGDFDLSPRLNVTRRLVCPHRMVAVNGTTDAPGAALCQDLRQPHGR